MTTIRALVAKADGEPGRDGLALAPGSVAPAERLPLVLEADPRRPVGYVALSVDGTDVYADITVSEPGILTGLTPALCGVAQTTGSSSRLVTGFLVTCVAACRAPNLDPRIPAIAGPPPFPPDRVMLEGEARTCRSCGSGRHAHRQGGPRGDHPFDPEPNWWDRLMAWARSAW